MFPVNNLEIYSSGKIIKPEEAAVFVSKLKSFGKKVGLCLGCFDLLHPGHVIHLESAKKLCDYLIVAVTADEFIISRKGSKRPILHEQLRAYMLASVEVIDCVVIQNFEKGTEIIELIKPSFYIKGPDIINLDTPAINEEREMVKKVGGEMRYTTDPKWATTEIIDFISNLDKKRPTKAIILSAGLGTRMGERTKDIPKVMLELNGKPLLLHTIERLKSYGIEEICLNLFYCPEIIKDYFGDGSKCGVKIHYNLEPELLGTSSALTAFKDILTEDFFVIYGDVIGDIDIENWVKFHNDKKSDATLIVHPSSHPEDSDIVQLDENSKVINLIKKPGNRNFGILGNAAWYIVSPKIFGFIPEGNSDFIRDVFPKMIEQGLNLYGYNTEEFLSDVGTPERFKRAEEFFKI